MRRSATLRLGLLSATILTSAALALPARAQEPQQAQEAAEADGDEIIVTGTRRATTVLDTPINIQAIGADDLARNRVEDVRDLADFTPGLTISETGPGSTGKIVMRGLSASDVSAGATNYDSAMGVYLGEVPLYYDFKLLDINRVETLLGPQGTLYGLGTLAGAIRYIPNRPDVYDFQAEVHGQAYTKRHASKHGYQMDGVINLPLVPGVIAFRSATGYYDDPGFIDYTMLLKEPGVSLPQPDGPNGVTQAGYNANLYRMNDLNYEKTFSSRNQLLFDVTPDLSVNFTYAYQQTKTEGAQVNSAGVFGTGKYENAARYTEPTKRHAHLVSMEVNANVADIFEVVATTAYTQVKTNGRTDNTDLLLDLDYDYELFPAFSSWNELSTKREQFNQEVRLVSSHGGPFSWVVGGFYNENKYQSDYKEVIPNHPWVDRDANPDDLEYVSYVSSKVTEKAIFGEGSFQITPQWQVTAGGRYFGYTSTIRGAAALPVLGDPVSPYDLTGNGGNASKDGAVWKFNSSYKITPDIMLYATYSKGYRLGGPNRVAPCPNPLPNDPDGDNVNNTQIICALPNEVQYGPDETKNLEVGFRAQLFDRKLSVNFDVYTIDWQGIQVASATLNGITGITVNGGSAKAKGLETSFQFKPIRELSIQGTYSYTDAYLTENVPGIIAVNSPAGTYPSRPIQLAAQSGDRLPGSAKNSGSLGVTYVRPVLDGELTANWTATYRGNVVSRLGWDRAYGDLIPSYTTHRASLSYDTDRYSVGLFATNIFDKYAVTAVNQDRSRVGVNDGVRLRYYGQSVLTPRTIGIEARFKY